MITQDAIINEYNEWLFNQVCRNRYSQQVSYRKLLTRLHDIEFTYTIPRDRNRAEDGMNLRYRFAVEAGYEDDADMIVYFLRGPCTVLEMMIALSIDCEDIMDEPDVGDRTGQWFWSMIVNLGLGSMTDDRCDIQRIDDSIMRFLNRRYEPNGKGGLFYIRNYDGDLRTMEIWHQLCHYLDTIV